VEAAHDADEVYDGSNVGAVAAGSGEGGVAGLVDEVGVGAAAEHRDYGLAVAIVEKGLVARLGEAGGLDIGRAAEAVGVWLEVESASEEVGVFRKGFGIGGRDTADVGKVGLDSDLLEASLDQILGGADEDARTATDGGPEGGEVTAGFWCQEEDDLLSLAWNRDGDAFFANFFVPGLDIEKPVVRWRIGSAAEEGGYQEIVNGLRRGQVGAEPELVSGLEVGNLGDREIAAAAGDVDINFRAGEVKTRGVFGVKDGGGEEEGG
jgi:hypothetical protein